MNIKLSAYKAFYFYFFKLREFSLLFVLNMFSQAIIICFKKSNYHDFKIYIVSTNHYKK